MKIKKEDIVWMIRQELKNLLDSYDQERTPGQEEGTEWFNEQPSKDDEQEELQEDEFVPGRSRRTEMKQAYFVSRKVSTIRKTMRNSFRYTRSTHQKNPDSKGEY